MVMTVPEEISRLKTRLAALEVGQNDIKAALNEIKDRLPTPKPEPRSPAPPAWAGSGENTGASYSGPPSVPQHAAAGISWVKERKENGDWRDSSGQLIVKPITPPSVGPSRDAQHQQSIELLDRIVSTTPIKE